MKEWVLSGTTTVSPFLQLTFTMNFCLLLCLVIFFLLVTSLLSLVSGKSRVWTPGSRVILASDGSCFSAKKLFKNLLCATRPTPNSRQTKTNRKVDVSFIWPET